MHLNYGLSFFYVYITYAALCHPRPESDYALKNEIERLKFDQSEQKKSKFLCEISIFNLNLQSLIPA